MKWLLIALSVLAACIALVVIVGYLLPATHSASRRARYRQPMATLFPILIDFAAFPSWRTGVTGIELLPPRDGKASFRETSRQGALTYVVDESTPPHRLVTRIVDNAAFGGTWTFELTDISSGCELTITERGEVYNPIFRVISRFFFSQTATMEAYLKSLGTRIGDPVIPAP